MPRLSAHGRLFWIAALSVIVLDVITKTLAVRLLTPYVPFDVLGPYGRFTLAYNRGAAFSMSLGAYSRVIFGAFAAIALVVLWRMYRAAGPGERLKVLGLGLAWGGAAGNLLDRLRSGRGVVDFIDLGVGTVRFWTFNVADSGVTIGACLLAVALWLEERQRIAARD
ncbi:MAG: signal peptidase II [Gemmatimonadota bacterium]|nr:signal peptidase II [Gemmatimonadota bacterium]MDE3127523.1 signal peptidase II [Gemmatimonadota bacterium]MDE3173634.1 signal peptidase II [Gemmatimonadota bacterium]MDE3214923.1 signal peptidase II [Gemmatimonadota bacterium]